MSPSNVNNSMMLWSSILLLLFQEALIRQQGTTLTEMNIHVHTHVPAYIYIYISVNRRWICQHSQLQYLLSHTCWYFLTLFPAVLMLTFSVCIETTRCPHQHPPLVSSICQYLTPKAQFFPRVPQIGFMVENESSAQRNELQIPSRQSDSRLRLA